MASIFTKIINRELPSYIIDEDENYIAFLDVFPLAKGHTLVVPKREVDYIFDLDDLTYLGLQSFAKKVGNLFIKTSISIIIMINIGIEPNPTISIAAAINMPNKSMIKYFMCFLEQIFLKSCIITI